jgi:hypothetical protein
MANSAVLKDLIGCSHLDDVLGGKQIRREVDRGSRGLLRETARPRTHPRGKRNHETKRTKILRFFSKTTNLGADSHRMQFDSSLYSTYRPQWRGPNGSNGDTPILSSYLGAILERGHFGDTPVLTIALIMKVVCPHYFLWNSSTIDTTILSAYLAFEASPIHFPFSP